MPELLAFSEKIEATAEARYLLQALICNRQKILATHFKVKSVSKLLYLTERLVRGASQELAEAGLLLVLSRSGKVGRPGLEYKASQHLRDLLAEPGQSANPYQELALRLFSEPDIYVECSQSEAGKREGKAVRKQIRKDGRPAAPGASGRLGVSTRVLLAALLTSADQFGVVTGMGEAQLRAMTGLNQVALKHQLRRLVSLGFIRVHVPGLSNGIFVGAKVSSIYYLNLSHPQLGDKRPRHIAWVLFNDELNGYERLTKGLSPEVEKALLALGPAVLNVLYHKLAGYASQLILDTWVKSDERQDDAFAPLVENIARELGQLKVGNPEWSQSNDYWAGMSKHFSQLALEWSQDLIRVLDTRVSLPRALIRPVPAQDRYGDERDFFLLLAIVPESQGVLP
ncbi:hypothetical protein [Ectopseudomonas toyotomiensis]|uniref:Uncharacterized protein n=1 Tax=Ectopseudomonas toyotomiensis TaxID=554344 RepID=A0AA42LDB5_9GAMM|nr:hypothetical protein [Pseudomonas toyotomiensis]MBG0843497.1 hypothetical protein [Pseudomonas toyotomiensis]MDH0701311.1 hypothetical protein [Pseudomonas toyotomiensis]